MTKEIFNKKKEKNSAIRKAFGFKERIRPLGLIKLSDKNIIKDLRDGLLTIQAGFVLEVPGIQEEKIGENIIAVPHVNKTEISGFDFLVCDDHIENIEIYCKNGVVPIIKKGSYLSSILSEFNPIKNEGNSYFYESDNKWLIFAAIIKYMENYKFTFDNKTLVKNVLSL